MDCVEIVHGTGKTDEILGPLRKSVKKWRERFSTAGIHLSLCDGPVESSKVDAETSCSAREPGIEWRRDLGWWMIPACRE